MMKNIPLVRTLAFCLLIASSWFLTSFMTKTQSPDSNNITLKEINNITLKEINNISYYKNGDLDSDLTKLNLIIPEGVENPPVFIWIGGGAWAYVNRHQEMDLCRAMAKQGVLMVSVGHRLSPALLMEPKNPKGIKHPEHVKDLAQAFKWVYENAEKYGYSNKNIFVGGFSSGAHLSALLAADGRYLEQVGLSTSDIKAIIPVGGAYDIPKYLASLIEEDPRYLENHIKPVFGETQEAYLDASPITYIDNFNTPMLLMSESDTYEYNVLFEQALKEKGKNNYVALNCHNETHSSLWIKLSKEENCIYRNYIVDYIQSFSRRIEKTN